MPNYKITFTLQSSICMQDRIMFDGVLAYAYAQENLSESELNLGKLSISKDKLLDFSPMPLKIDEEKGYFMASWMFYDEMNTPEFTGSWKKRWDNQNDTLASFGKRKRKIRVNAGQFKSYDMPMRMLDVKRCWFYFQSENVAEVERLLKAHIVGLGKKISQGNGWIEAFTIEKINHNPFEKEIIRPIPIHVEMDDEMAEMMNLNYMGWRPPYWLPENQTFCQVKK